MSPLLFPDRSADGATPGEAPNGLRSGRILAGFVAFLLVLLIGAYLALPWAAGIVIRGVLADLGYPKATVRVTDIGLTEIKLADVSLAPTGGVAARRVTIDYTPGRLAQGSIDGIELEAPHLPVTVRPAGLDFGVLAPLLESSGSGGGMRIIGPVVVREGVLQIATSFGIVEARLDGQVLFTDGLGTRIEASVDLTHPDVRLKARVDGTLNEGGATNVDVVISDAASTAPLAFSEMTGTLHLGGTPPAILDGAGTLTMRGVAVAGQAIGNLELSGTLTDTRAVVDLVLGGDGTGLSAHANVQTDNVIDPAAPVLIRGDAATDGLKGPARLPGALDAVGAVDFEIEGSRRDLQALAAALDGAPEAPAGRVHAWIAADQLSVTDRVKGFDAILNGRLEGGLTADGWSLSALEPLKLEAGASVGGERHTLSAAIGARAGAVMLQGGLDRSKPVSALFRVDGSVDRRHPLAGDVDGKLWLDAAKGLVVEDLALKLDTKPLKFGKLDVAVENASLHLSGAPGDMTLDVVAAAGLNGPLGDINVVGGRIDLQSRVDIGADGVRAFPPGCLSVRAVTLRGKDVVVRPQPAKLCPPADGAPMLTARFENGALKRIEAAAVIGSTELVAEGLLAYPLSGTLPRLDTQAVYDPARDTWWLRFGATGGALRVEGPDIALADVDAKGEVAGKGGQLVGVRMPALVLKLVDHRRPQRVAPVEISGKGEFNDRSVQFDGGFAAPGGLQGKLALAHRFDSGRGYVSASVPGWRFEGESAQPMALFPASRGVLTGASGAIAAETRIDWTPARTSSSAKIALDNLAFTSSAVDVAGLTGTVRLSDVLRPTTDGVQTLSLGLVDAGLPLAGGTAAFAMPGDGTLRVHKVSWPFAGGSIGISDVSMPLDDMPKSLAVDIVGLDAASLVKMADVSDLAAQGMLAGRVPITLGPDGPAIDGARLKSVGGGLIRYRAEAAAETLKQSGGSGELLAKALENFQFTDVEMALDGPLNGEIKARAEIKGSNPDLYDGKRIELNVNLSGVLRDVLRSATVFKDLPATIRDRVQGSAGTR